MQNNTRNVNQDPELQQLSCLLGELAAGEDLGPLALSDLPDALHALPGEGDPKPAGGAELRQPEYGVVQAAHLQVAVHARHAALRVLRLLTQAYRDTDAVQDREAVVLKGLLHVIRRFTHLQEHTKRNI